MAGIISRTLRSKGRRMPGSGSSSQFFERLEDRAYLAAVSITGPAEVDETAGTAQFVVSLSEKAATPVTVSYSLQANPATATYGRDFRLFNGRTQLRPSGSLTFQRGQTTQIITMNIVNDDLREGNEQFTIALQGAQKATLNPQARSVGVTIRDNDNYSVAIVGPATVADGTTIEYRLQLSSPATRRETFYVSTRDGTGQVNQDYLPLTRVPVTILPGQSSALVRVVTIANSAPDYDRIFFLDVVPATPGFPSPTPFQVTIPGPLGPIPPNISISDVTVAEGTAGANTTAQFLVSLSFASAQPVSVDYATSDGTATVADGDYVSTAGTLVFAPGETSKLVSVTVVGDTKQESDETFQVILSNSPNAFIERSSATGTITNDDEPAFKINVVFPDNSLTAAQKDVFLQAASRWSEIIVGDVPDQSYQGRIIDDLEISATAPYIDGAGGILGQAGPRAFRTGSFLPYLGEMEFDSADVATMVSDGTFTSVILHEMGHVLGIGTLWRFKNLVTGIGTNNPTYVGANAVREYQTLSGTSATSVPVENVGGGGTVGSHWRESVFKTELMTGYAEPAGVAMPISRMTVGSLQDLGYTVDYAAADPYSLNLRQAAIDFQRLMLTPTNARSMLLMSGGQGLASLQAAASAMGMTNTSGQSLSAKAFRAIASVPAT